MKKGSFLSLIVWMAFSNITLAQDQTQAADAPFFYQGREYSLSEAQEKFNLHTRVDGNEIKVFGIFIKGCETKFEAATKSEKSEITLRSRTTIESNDKCVDQSKAYCIQNQNKADPSKSKCHKVELAKFSMPDNGESLKVYLTRTFENDDMDAVTERVLLVEQKGALALLEEKLKGKSRSDLACSGCVTRETNGQEIQGSLALASRIVAETLFDATKEDIEKAKTSADLEKIKKELNTLKANADPSVRSKYDELLAMIAGREATIKDEEIEAYRDQISAIKDIDELEKLYRERLAAIINRNKKKDSAEQKLLTAYNKKKTTLLEKSLKSAKTSDLEKAADRYMEHARKMGDEDKAYTTILENIRSRAGTAKFEQLDDLKEIADNYMTEDSSNDDDDYEYGASPEYIKAVSAIAGRKVKFAMDEKDPGVRDEMISDVRYMLEDIKSEAGDRRLTAEISSLINGLDRQKAQLQSREMLGGVFMEMSMMSPIEAQLYGPQMIQGAIMSSYEDLYRRTESEFYDACYGVSYSSGSWGPFGYSKFSNTGGPRNMEGRIACGSAKSSYVSVKSAMQRDYNMAKGQVDRAISSSSNQNGQQGQGNNPFGGGLFDQGLFGNSPFDTGLSGQNFLMPWKTF